MIGIHRSTLWEWKRRGRDPNEREPIYGAFYERYQQACGLRTLTWIEGVKDTRWLLERHPNSKEEFATLTTLKTESAVTVTSDVQEYIKALDNYRKTLRKQENQT